MSVFLTPQTDTGLELTWASLERKYLAVCHASRVGKQMNIAHRPMPKNRQRIDNGRRRKPGGKGQPGKPVVTSLGERFATAALAADAMGVTRSAICQAVLKGHRVCGRSWRRPGRRVA